MDDALVPVNTALASIPGVEVTHIGALYGGGQIKLRFPNGYGASIIRHDGSYGGREGFFELAVLSPDGELDYTTPITSDVEGWLTPEAVRDLCVRIAALPSKEYCNGMD